MAKHRHSTGGDKYVQTRLDTYFKVKGELLFTPKVKGKSKLERPARNICGKLWKMEADISVAKVEKRDLPVRISDDESSETEDMSNQSKNSFVPESTSTPKKSRQTETFNEIQPTPSTSGINKKCNSSVSEVQASKSPEKPSKYTPKVNKNTSRNITVLENVIISPAKPEQKKINYETSRVMKDFFLNVLNADHLKYLLGTEERDMLYILFNSDKNYQYTCIKLFLWKTQFYNIFRYTEKIGLQLDDNDVITMYNFLKENEFVDTDYLKEDLFTLLNLLSLKELREIQRSFKFRHPCTTTNEIIAKLIKNCKSQGTLTCNKSTEQVLRERIQQKLGYCVKLSEKLAKALNHVYTLNTFTNPSFLRIQDYLKDLNIVYPSYDVEPLHIFGRNEFLKFAEALDLKRDLETAIEKKNIANIIQICGVAYSALKNNLQDYEENFSTLHKIEYLERFSAHYQYVTILSRGSEFIKGSYPKEVKTWLEFLISQKSCSHKRGHWYCLLSLIYTTHLKEYEQAAKLIISTFENEKEHLSEVQLYELAFRGKVLNKKTYNLPPLFHDKIAELSPPSCDRSWPAAFIESRTVRNNEPGQKRKYIQELANGDRNYLTVEQVALEHYEKSGYPHGLHCEGSVISALFCLLFWDIIYRAYVKGAFISNMQNAPLDMFTKYFYENRRLLIEQRLNSLRTGWEDEAVKGFLLHAWEQHSHEFSLCPIDSIVSNGEQLYQILECIGRFTLTKILERLVKNYRVYHSGFPDLIVWNYEAKKCKFVEVKGENDQLSIKQKLWMKYLMDIGASVELCNVHSTGSKKKNIGKKGADD